MTSGPSPCSARCRRMPFASTVRWVTSVAIHASTCVLMLGRVIPFGLRRVIAFGLFGLRRLFASRKFFLLRSRRRLGDAIHLREPAAYEPVDPRSRTARESYGRGALAVLIVADVDGGGPADARDHVAFAHTDGDPAAKLGGFVGRARGGLARIGRGGLCLRRRRCRTGAARVDQVV